MDAISRAARWRADRQQAAAPPGQQTRPRASGVITQAVLNLIVALFTAVFQVLPIASLSTLFVEINTALIAAGAGMSGWNAFLPLSELCSILAMLLGTWLPAILIYKAVNWAWKHMPMVGRG
jgi:MFS superfamily sulfate permease-like transporter